MGKIPLNVQEIVFGSSERAENNKIAVLLKKKTIRKIAPRIYTSNLEEKPAAIVRRNWFRILAHLYPSAVMSHRSALEFKPTSEGHIYLTWVYNGNVELPGLHVHLLAGQPALEEDKELFEGLRVSHEARAFLENLQQSRKKGEESKTLSRQDIEERLDAIARARGENALNKLRDAAREIAKPLQMEKEFKKLNQLISDLLSTGESKNLTSSVALARALGEPVDPERIRTFEALYEALAGKVFADHREGNKTAEGFKTFAFFESYFSNYIEGTEFTVEEAREIVISETPMPSREEDSHDMLGTFQLVADQAEMSVCPKSADELLNLLRSRHAVLLRARKNKKPGEFKDKNNRAGATEFVDVKLVSGTLRKGFEWYSLLQSPFAKATYMMFLISEVHPFLDGNGRIARVMMNAELTSQGLSKIIIPTVYREDYLGALRKLTKQRKADAYVRMLARAHEFSATLIQNDLDAMEKFLLACNAFQEPTQGKLNIIR